MTPSLPNADAPRGIRLDAKYPRNGCAAFSIVMPGSHCNNIFISKLGISTPLATRTPVRTRMHSVLKSAFEFFGMQSGSIPITRCLPSFLDFVRFVLGMGSEKQVMRRNAIPNITFVTNKKPFRNLAELQNPAKTMSGHCFRARVKKAISTFKFSSSPQPARAKFSPNDRPIFINLRPEASNNIRVQYHKRKPPVWSEIGRLFGLTPKLESATSLTRRTGRD